MSTFFELFTIVIPVFIVAGVGFVWGKKGEPFEAKFVTRLVGQVGAPCLIFAALVQTDVSPATLGQTSFVMILCVLLFTLIGAGILRLMKLPNNVHLPPLLNPNTGNMGLPICLYAFGEKGLALAVAVFATLTVIAFTLNVWIAAGSTTWKDSLKQPAIISAALGTLVMGTGFEVPTWLINTTELVGGATIPLMLLSLGVSMSQLQVTHLQQSVVLASIRLGMGFSVAYLLTGLLDLDPLVRAVVVTQASMPAAVFTFLFAQIYDRRPEEVAGTIVVSTLMSMVTIPMVLWVVLPV